jgi:hypothetical protein
MQTAEICFKVFRLPEGRCWRTDGTGDAKDNFTAVFALVSLLHPARIPHESTADEASRADTEFVIRFFEVS